MPQSPQKYLGTKGLIILIAFLSAFVPLSTDLYLPALPGMSAYFGVGTDQTNLTLTSFFVFYALGTLVWGPLSDRFGRRPILIIGLSVYIAASGLCAMAGTIEGLIVCRIFQAVGGSAAGTIATAIVKDVYTGKKREKVLAIVQSMVTISPAVAPVLGAFLLRVMSWRGVFWALAVIGVLALAGSLLFEESIRERSGGMVFQSLGRLVKVLQNRGFTLLLLLFSLNGVSMMAFIASSTYIYQENFHLSGQIYSFYFSLNALMMMAGPMVYLRLARHHHPEKIVRNAYIVIAVSGFLICLLGNLQPWVFALCMLPATLASSCTKPVAANMMLEQQQGDTGSVSSLMSCVGMLMGSLGMQLVSLPWGNMIITLGVMILSTSTLVLLAWPFILRFTVRLPGPSVPEAQ